MVLDLTLIIRSDVPEEFGWITVPLSLISPVAMITGGTSPTESGTIRRVEDPLILRLPSTYIFPLIVRLHDPPIVVRFELYTLFALMTRDPE